MVIIRQAEHKDVEEVVDLIYLAIKDIAYQLTGEVEYEAMCNQLKNFYLQNNNRFSSQLIQVYEVDGCVVSMILCYHGKDAQALYKPIVNHLNNVKKLTTEIDNEADRDDYYIDAVAVTPKYQGQGIAKKMFEAAEQYAAMQNYSSISLNVDIDNEGALKLYTKLGFIQKKKIYINSRPYWYMVKSL